jgi:aminopeptidase N
VIYKDVGGFALIATNLFPNFTQSVMPCLADPMRKVSIRLSILHPKNTIALSNMHQEHSSFEAYEHWRLTDFVQAANLPSYMFSFAVLPEIMEKSQASSRYPLFVFTNKVRPVRLLKDQIVGLAGAIYDEVYNMLEEPLPFTHINLVFMNEFNGTQSTGLLFFDEEAFEDADVSFDNFSVFTNASIFNAKLSDASSYL